MRKIKIPWKPPKLPATNAITVFFFVPAEVTKCVGIDSLRFPGIPGKSRGGAQEPAR